VSSTHTCKHTYNAHAQQRHALPASFTRMDPGSFPVVERGFNWIQEQPHNR